MRWCRTQGHGCKPRGQLRAALSRCSLVHAMQVHAVCVDCVQVCIQPITAAAHWSRLLALMCLHFHPQTGHDRLPCLMAIGSHEHESPWRGLMVGCSIAWHVWQPWVWCVQLVRLHYLARGFQHVRAQVHVHAHVCMWILCAHTYHTSICTMCV